MQCNKCNAIKAMQEQNMISAMQLVQWHKCNVMNSMWYMQYNEFIVLNAI